VNDLPRLAISIRQPWAYCILHLGKDIENRDWSTNFRGDVCVHAAKGMTRSEYEDCLATVHAVSEERPFPSGRVFPEFDVLARGGIVGVVNIANCIPSSASPWFVGKHGFVLRNARPVEFIPVRGALGFFDWRSRMP